MHGLDLLVAKSVEARVEKERYQLARWSVRRGHREFPSVHPREFAEGFGKCHRSAATAHPFTERPQGPVGEPTEHCCTVVGAIVITEAANDRVGFLNLLADREGVIAKQG